MPGIGLDAGPFLDATIAPAVWAVVFFCGLAVVLWLGFREPVWFTMGACYVYFAIPTEEFWAPEFKYQAVLFVLGAVASFVMYPALFDRWAREELTERAKRAARTAVERASQVMSEALVTAGDLPDSRPGAIKDAMMNVGRKEARRAVEDQCAPALKTAVLEAVEQTLAGASRRADAAHIIEERMRRSPRSTRAAIARDEVAESFRARAADGLEEHVEESLEKAHEHDAGAARSRRGDEGPLGIPLPMNAFAGIFTNVGFWLHIVFIVLTYIGAHTARYDTAASMTVFETSYLLLIPIVGILAGVRTPRHFLMYVGAWCFGVWHIAMNGVRYWVHYGGRADYAGGQGGEANFLGGIAVSVAPIMFALALNLKVPWHRLFALGNAGIYTLAILASGSRAGFLSFGVALGYWVVQTNRKLVAIGIMTMAGSGFLIAAPESFWERMGTIIGMHGDNQWVQSAAEPSAAARLVLWGLALDLWQENPVTGIGPYNYIRVSGEETEFVDAYLGERGLQAHNTWFQLLAEYGTVGTIVWGGSFLLSLFLLRRARKKMRQYEGMEWFCALCLGLEAGGVGTASVLMFNSYQWYDYIYWFMITGPLALSIASRHAARLDWFEPPAARKDKADGHAHRPVGLNTG